MPKQSSVPDLGACLIGLRIIVASCLNAQQDRRANIDISSLNICYQGSGLAQSIAVEELTTQEWLVLLLALVPHLVPNFFNQIIAEHLPEGGEFPHFGGVKGTNHRGILPTGETAQFILAGDDLKKRLEVQRLFGSDHWFAHKRIVWLAPVPEGEPLMSGRLVLDPEIVELFTIGKISRPRFSNDFPAEHIHTDMSWDDLVLRPATLCEIHEIEHWITHNETLLSEWGMKKRIKPGYRALFHGPPGTGKTLTATLLGKHTGRDVFRIDLSRTVSKYIGETEKNLSRLFDKAEHKDWILLFDEADALFGKRTEIRDAHDKYANQEVSYLLQRIESYNGLVILASNQRSHIDDAFVRRFQTMIHFPMPGAEERFALWTHACPKQIDIAPEIDWRKIAARYELSGASIMNIIHYCSVEALADRSHALSLPRLDAAILREYMKEGKVV
jgi:hypothetical protein